MYPTGCVAQSVRLVLEMTSGSLFDAVRPGDRIRTDLRGRPYEYGGCASHLERLSRQSWVQNGQAGPGIDRGDSEHSLGCGHYLKEGETQQKELSRVEAKLFIRPLYELIL